MGVTNSWWPLVNNLLDGEGYASCFDQYFPFCGPENNTTAAREPIPVFIHTGLAFLTGRSLFVAALFHVLLGIACAWLIFLIGKRWENARIGLLAAACWALYLSAYKMLNTVGGENLALFFGLLVILKVQSALESGKTPDWILSGLLIGVTILSRTSLMAFVPAIGLVLLFTRIPFAQRITRILFIGFGLIVVLAPWSYRNHSALGTWSFGSTLTGYNVFRHTAALSEGNYMRYIGPAEAEERVKELVAAHPELRGDENEVEMNSFYMAQGIANIKADPWPYVQQCGYRLVAMWTDWNIAAASNRKVGLDDYLVIIQQLLFLALALFGLRMRSDFDRIIILTLVVYCGLHMGVVGRIRYLLPLMPILFLFSARTLNRIIPSKSS